MADDEEVPSPDEKRSRIPTSAKMPSATPEAASKVVSALAELAGPASRERLASHMGVQLTGGVARALSSALLYGFIEIDSDKKLVVTARGLGFVGEDEEAAKQAAREGIMATSFGPVVKKLSTRKADAVVVAVRMQEDQGLDERAAKDRASLLVKAATAAALVVNGNFDGGAIEDTIAVVGEPSAAKPSAPASATPKSKPKPAAKAADAPEAAAKDSADASDGKGAKGGKADRTPDAPFEQAATAPLQIVLHIDASKLDAAQIGQIVRELRASATVSTHGS